MKKYRMLLSAGECGETIIEAESAEDALEWGLAWAARGDWTAAQEETESVYGGCGDVTVSALAMNGDPVDRAEGVYTIPTLGDLRRQDAD